MRLFDPFASDEQLVYKIHSKLKSEYKPILAAMKFETVEELNDACLRIEPTFKKSKDEDREKNCKNGDKNRDKKEDKSSKSGRKDGNRWGQLR